MRSLLAVGLLWTTADALDNGLGRTPPMGFNTARARPFRSPGVWGFWVGWGAEAGRQRGLWGRGMDGRHDAGALLPQL